MGKRDDIFIFGIWTFINTWKPEICCCHRINSHTRQNFSWLRVWLFLRLKLKVDKNMCLFDNQEQTWKLKRKHQTPKQSILCFTNHWDAHYWRSVSPVLEIRFLLTLAYIYFYILFIFTFFFHSNFIVSIV